MPAWLSGPFRRELREKMLSLRPMLAALTLALFCAACAASGSPTPTALPVSALTATAVAATSDAQVEAWAIATGTALKLTAKANLTPPPPTLTPGLGQPLATADLGICSPLATDCAPTANSPTIPPRATATPPAATAVPVAPTSKPPSPPPVATTGPAATPSDMECYAKPCQRELVAPNGHGRWPEMCTFLGIGYLCYITFPNGQVTPQFNWSVLWSADNLFLAVPEGGSHDSYAAGYQIWNMDAGARTGRIDYNFSRQWWSPVGHTLAYVKRLPGGAQELHLLDAATGDDQPTRQCPAWATDQLKISDDFDWRTVCDNWTPAAGQPVILSFTTSPAEAGPGDQVTLAWTSTGSTSAEIRQNLANDTRPVPIGVSLSGTLVITLPPDNRMWHSFELWVSNDTDKWDSRWRNVNIRCPEAFYFAAAPPPASAGCPYLPADFVAAVEQPFEHGRMIWLAPLPGGQTGSGVAQPASVYVLYPTGILDAWPTWRRYDDTWTAHEPESDPTLEVPAGLFQPQRGFGKVWRANTDVRQNLGWATAPEGAYSGAYQVNWAFGARPGDIFLRAADGGILKMTSSGFLEKWQP
jgi:hypothetical protein